MADLDHFKQVNDNYGHLAGDAVLRKVGKIFNETLRSIDTAGRYGGEEFLIILDNTGEQEAEQTAERIRKAVEESRITRDGKTIQVTISIGVATICDMVSMDDGQLIGIADKALYEAKQQGRNRIVVATIKSSE
jgi:diguanylate cyclase (GGDEF)-like protein